MHVSDVDADACDLLASDANCRLLVETPERAAPDFGFAAEEEVAVDRQHRDDRQVLVDGGNAAIEGVARRAEGDRLAVQADFSGVGREHAGEDLDQRRLAGAVVAEQAGHLAGVHGQRDARQRLDRAKGLADIARREQRRAGVHRDDRRIAAFRV